MDGNFYLFYYFFRVYIIIYIYCIRFNYFTETLVDVFRQGTIPIFWGCPNIAEYFNKDGILHFNTGQELFDILDNISEDLYERKLEAVRENNELAKQYVSMDDTFATNLINEFPELLDD